MKNYLKKIVKITRINKFYSDNFEQNFIDKDIYFDKYKYLDERVLSKLNNMTKVNHKLTQF